MYLHIRTWRTPRSGAMTCQWRSLMSIKVGSLSKGPACEDKVMIVEVIGKAHPEGQKIVIFDGADESIQTDLTDQKKTEEIKVDGRSSVLHIWPWCNQPRRNLWLEIEAEGEPIYVPILKGARETPRELGHQRNVLLPIVPMTHVYGASADWHTWRQTVLARPGYFYIFLDGKIWRELKIRTENGVTTYHDVRLDKFRGESGLFHADERAAEGKGLGEIWLPAILNWKLVRGLEVAYAEDQWPAARLNRLEQNSELRGQRCTALEFDYSRVYKGCVSRLDNFKAHRPRDADREWEFDQPQDYLTDLSGEYPEKSFKIAEQVHAQLEDKEPLEEAFALKLDTKSIGLETEAWDYFLRKTCNELLAERRPLQESETSKKEESPEPDAATKWVKEPSVQDALADACSRQIGAVIVEDTLYRFFHLIHRAQTAYNLLVLAIKRAELREHHESAVILDRLVLPEYIGNKRNPLHDLANKALTKAGKRRIEYATCALERRLARDFLRVVQNNIVVWLEQKRHQQVIGDLFCFNGGDYVGAFAFVSQLFEVILPKPETVDEQARPLFSSRVDCPGKKLIRELYLNEKHPLNKMIWPEAELEDVMRPYELPKDPVPNRGDGLFRPQELARFENEEFPDPMSLRTLYGALLANAAKRGDFNTLLSLKSGANTLSAILGSLQDSVLAAIQAVEESEEEYRKARDELKKELKAVQDAEAEVAKRHQDLATQEHQLRVRRRSLVISEREFALKESELQQARKQLEDELKTLALKKEATQAKAIELEQKRADFIVQASWKRAAMYCRAVELSRSAMPNFMSLLQFTERAGPEHYVFAISELDDASLRISRIYGELTDTDEVLGSTNKKYIDKETAAGGKQNVLLLVVEKNSDTAKQLQEANKLWAELRVATEDVEVLNAEVAKSQQIYAAALEQQQKAAKEVEKLRGQIEEFEGRGGKIQMSQGLLDKAKGVLFKAENKLEWVKGEVKKASDQLGLAKENLKGRQENWVYRGLNTAAFPMVVLMLELWNVQAEFNAFERVSRQRSIGRARWGAGSAVYDGALASLTLAEKFAQNTQVGRFIAKGTELRPIALSKSLAERFPKAAEHLTLKRLAGSISGYLFAGISFTDAWHEFALGDDAGLGYSLMVAGGVVGGTGALMGSSSVLLGLGPKGWLILGLAL